MLKYKIMENEKNNNQLQIELKEEVAQGTYANLAIITHSSSEFIVDFVSYNYGAANHAELKNLFRKSLSLIGISGVAIAILSQFLAIPLSILFVGYDKELLLMTQHAFRIYCLVYLVNQFNIYGSSFFTALNNGLISAVISFLRTLLFQVGAVIVLPMIFGIKGIWSEVTIAEILTLCVTVTFLVKQRGRYHYA